MIPDPTTTTAPRKRKAQSGPARSRGRPALPDPRRVTLPRVTRTAHQALTAFAEAQQISLADALDRAIHGLFRPLD